jgi:hypothetical protein
MSHIPLDDDCSRNVHVRKDAVIQELRAKKRDPSSLDVGILALGNSIALHPWPRRTMLSLIRTIGEGSCCVTRMVEVLFWSESTG